MSELPKESSVTGVKAVLTEAIASHAVKTLETYPTGDVIDCVCGWWYEPGDHAVHVAEVLAALPGVAVIQLPEPATLTPAYEDDVTHAWEWDGDSFLALGGDGIAGGTHLLDSRHVEDLLPLAAAILAAARVYELRLWSGEASGE